MTDFVPFPKMSRLNRDIIVTEKIDGTNACIRITEDGQFLTGSRTRWITPQDDNAGFSRWAHEHKDELMQLGVGLHFGEWWGSGVQRGYGLSKGEKRFSLFNVARWCLADQKPLIIYNPDPRIEKYQEKLPACCHLVPKLYSGVFDMDAIESALAELRQHGSKALPGFSRPEGVVVYHVAAGIGFKRTLEKDEQPKSLVKSESIPAEV